MEGFIEAFRSRALLPLEAICTFSILLAFLIPAITEAPPFKLCGHVYGYFTSVCRVLCCFCGLKKCFVVLNGDYDDPGLEVRNWTPVETEAAANDIREAIRNATQGAVFDAGDGIHLYVYNTSDFGLKGSPKSLLAPSPGFEAPVQVNKDTNFRSIPLRVPYVMWYGIYGMILEMDGYVGAEEIDKCIIWLLLVLAITELIGRSQGRPLWSRRRCKMKLNGRS